MADRNMKVMICVLSLLISAGFIAIAQGNNPGADTSQQKPDGIRNDVNKFEIELTAEETEADNFVKQAGESFQNDEFEKSVNSYISAKKLLEKIGGTSNSRLIRKINSIDEAISVVYHYWAEKTAVKAEAAADAEQYDKAISLCEDAKKISSSSKTKMDKLIEHYTEMKKTIKYRNETSDDYLMPNKKDKEYNIDVLFEQGKKFYEDGQYDKARDKLEGLLVLDPYHMKAIRYIKLINEKLYETGTIRFEDTRKERLTESAWESSSPILPRAFTGEKEILQAPIEKKEGLSDIQKKLEKIIIDHMDFEEVSIPIVVNYLKARSKDLDPEGEGVNIFLRLTTATPREGGAAAAPAAGEETPAAAEPAAAEGEATETVAETQNVTVLVDDIPLIEAIKYICRLANLKYRIEKFAVIIAAQDVPLDELETRIYPVEQEVFSELVANAAAGGAAGGGAGEAAGGAGGGGTTTSAQSFFASRGVAFPEGSRVIYDSAISRLIATNTPDNLEKIEKIIKELNVTDPQVLIESKFVEISENDLNSLGIEWSVQKPATNPAAAGFQTSPAAMTFNQNDQINRFASAIDPVWAPNNDVIFNVTHSTDSGVTYNAMLHALNLSYSSDILSSPRITTQNGEEATIRMITEVYLPESWSEAQYIPGILGLAGGIFMPSVPTFGTPTDLGVTLTVTPTVDADRYTIALDMRPVVQSLSGWIDYSYQVPNTLGGSYTNRLQMPIVEARTVTTQLTVYDGETVVMGGVTRNNADTINDQVPLLGTLPLVGRLFQSKVDDNTKRNLLIFTTVRLVQPDGSPYRAREIRGLPPFRQ